MADDADATLMMTVLRDIRAELGLVRATQADHTARLGRIQEQVADIAVQATYALGAGESANVRSQRVSSRLETLGARVDEAIDRILALEDAPNA